MFSIPSELLSIVSIKSLDKSNYSNIKNLKFVCRPENYISTSKEYNNKNFTNCELNTCVFRNCKFNSVVFTRSQLLYVDFVDCTFVNCKFCECLLCRTHFNRCQFDNVHFNESILLSSIIRDLSLINCHSSNILFCTLKATSIDIFSATSDAKLMLRDNMCKNCNTSQRSEQYLFCNATTTNYYPHCPETGSYIAYKKAIVRKTFTKVVYVIVKLQILANAKRTSAGDNKCRASAAKVLSISSIDKKTYYKKAFSMYASTFIYEVGKIVKVTDFDENRWNECAPGIHHFLTRKEAEVY